MTFINHKIGEKLEKTSVGTVLRVSFCLASASISGVCLVVAILRVDLRCGSVHGDLGRALLAFMVRNACSHA